MGATEKYLKAIVDKAKELLPADFFDEMHRKARASAGGQKRAEMNRISLSDMNSEVMKSADHSQVNNYWRKVNKMYEVAKSSDSITDELMSAATNVVEEMEKRGISFDKRLELYNVVEKTWKVKKSFSVSDQLAKDVVLVKDLVRFMTAPTEGHGDTTDVGLFLDPRFSQPGKDLVIKSENVLASLVSMFDTAKEFIAGAIDNPKSAQGSPLFDLVLRKNDSAAEAVFKGYDNGEADGGSHAHAIDRFNKTTAKDGAHFHVFMLKDGQLVYTNEDGLHTHSLDESHADIAGPNGAAHTHTLRVLNRVETEDFVIEPNTVLETELGGSHSHTNLFETTGFNGIHTHKLTLPDGSVVESLTPGDYYRLMGLFQTSPQPLPPASVLIRAFYEAKCVEMARRIEAQKAYEYATMYCNEVQQPEAFPNDVVMALAAVGVGENALVMKECEDEKANRHQSSEPPEGTPEIEVPIMKSDREKRIVYGIVMKADTFDKQGDTITFDELEDAAAHYLAEERFVCFRHTKRAPATVKVIASICVMAKDVFHGIKMEDGAWILGVKVDDDNLWDLIQDGQINAFSPGGTSLRKKIS